MVSLIFPYFTLPLAKLYLFQAFCPQKCCKFAAFFKNKAFVGQVSQCCNFSTRNFGVCKCQNCWSNPKNLKCAEMEWIWSVSAPSLVEIYRRKTEQFDVSLVCLFFTHEREYQTEFLINRSMGQKSLQTDLVAVNLSNCMSVFCL